MGLLGGAWDAVAGVGDHAAGSVDESIGRQFDSRPGGGLVDLAPDGERAVADTDGDGSPDEFNNRFLQGSAVRTAYDVVFSYDGTLNGREDTADVFGPTVGGVADAVVDVEGETHGSEETKARWLIYAAVAAVALYLLAPVLDLLAGVTGE